MPGWAWSLIGVGSLAAAWWLNRSQKREDARQRQAFMDRYERQMYD